MGIEMTADCQSTTPHTQENLQAGSRVGGDHCRMAAEEIADAPITMIGNGGDWQAVGLCRLNRLLRQCCDSNAAALDIWLGGRIHRLTGTVGNRRMATRCLHWGEFCSAMLHEDTARSGR